MSDFEDIDLSDDLSVNFSNGWTDEKEKFMKKLANKRGALTWLYHKSADHYSKIDFRLGILLAVSAYLFGVGGLPTLSILSTDSTIANMTVEQAAQNAEEIHIVKIVNIAIQALVILIGVFETIMLVLDLQGKAKQYKWVAGKSSSLFLDIRKEVKKPISKRVDADKFIHKILEKDIDLYNESETIPTSKVRQYYEKYGDRAIPYEELFGESILLLEIEDTEDSADVVSRAMRATQKMEQNRTIVKQPSIEQCIKEHHDKKKWRREIPKLSARQMFDLENYLDE